jgi:Ca2+/Na+ antiporter
MEFISGLFIGYVVSWYGILGLSLICLISVHTDSRIASAIFMSLLTYTVYRVFNLSFIQMIYGMIGYVCIGFLWSFWRYKKYVRSSVENYNRLTEHNQSARERMNKDTIIKELDVKNRLHDITFWILMFPFSMLENILGDLIDTLKRIIVVYCKSIYRRIMENELKDLNI